MSKKWRKKKTTLKEFIKKARDKHGNKYCYALVSFKNINDTVKILCGQHGLFEQKAKEHLNGKKCRLCSIEEQKMPREQFIEEAKKIHGDNYSFLNVPDKISIDEEIEAVCNSCQNAFKSTRRKIKMSKTPCPFCYSKIRGKQRTKNFEWFKEKAEKVHGDKYSLYKEKYINTKTKTIVRCNHCQKDIIIFPLNFLKGQGCKECGQRKSAKTRMLQQIVVENELQKACSNKFSFETFKYDARRTIINFKCFKHNFSFKQSFSSFRTNGICCPLCKEKSKAEREVRQYLDEQKIKYISQQKMEGLFDKKALLPDFFLIEKKIMIEVNGIHHKYPTDYSGKLTWEETVKQFHKQKHHDWLKRKYCQDNGYKYEEIWYYENTIEKLKTILK